MSATFIVSITNAGAAGDSAGFIDPKRLEQYGTTGASAQHSINKKRANLRFDMILSSIAMATNVTVKSAETVGASNTEEGTVFEMTVEFSSLDSVYILRDDQPITGALAIRRMVAEAISSDATNLRDFYIPGEEAGQDHRRTENVVVGRMAADTTEAMALITVTAI
jgi:hypothetical protein